MGKQPAVGVAYSGRLTKVAPVVVLINLGFINIVQIAIQTVLRGDCVGDGKNFNSAIEIRKFRWNRRRDNLEGSAPPCGEVKHDGSARFQSRARGDREVHDLVSSDVDLWSDKAAGSFEGCKILVGDNAIIGMDGGSDRVGGSACGIIRFAGSND